MTDSDPPNSGIQVIDRAVALLDALARRDEAASLKLLGLETGLSPSTAFRILAALGEHGLVARDGAGKYLLGARLLHLAARVRSRLDLREVARPEMERLRDQTGETVNLTLREGDEVVYVERVTSHRMMRVEQVIGSRAPLHVTAVGKLMLGEAGPEACRDYARRTGLRAFTGNTLSQPDRLILNIETARSLGYALDDEEAETGVGCIGVLVREAGGAVVGGLSVSAPIERRQDGWIPLVIEAGQRISRKLGYAG
jgi:DNA-binding IclR family transcriptional regulator